MAAVERLQSSVIDGRAATPRFKQRQLTALHEALSANRESLIAAKVSDSSISQAEASAIYFLALDAVKKFYESLNLEDLLKDEYSLAEGKSRPSRRVPVGYVHLTPDNNDLLYSTVVPLAAAIAAGNCVLLELHQTLSELSSLLRKVLSAALERDTFILSDGSKIAPDFEAQYACKLDYSSPRDRRVVAIVDRSANLSQAAQDLVSARMAFNGKSSYAPDFVFVNEFALDDFAKAAVQTALPILSAGSKSSRKQASTSDDLTYLSTGSAGSIAVAKDRTKISPKPLQEPTLIIVPFSSLDDAIDFLNHSSTESLQVLYSFGAPRMTKYLSQFVRSDISFANHIPAEILIGPASPRIPGIGGSRLTNMIPAQVHPRFTVEMFSMPVPEYSSGPHSPVSEQIAKLLRSPNQQSSTTALIQSTKIAPLNEPLGGSLGFFERGIVTGGSILLSTIVIGSATAIRYGYPFLMNVARSTLALKS